MTRNEYRTAHHNARFRGAVVHTSDYVNGVRFFRTPSRLTVSHAVYRSEAGFWAGMLLYGMGCPADVRRDNVRLSREAGPVALPR